MKKRLLLIIGLVFFCAPIVGADVTVVVGQKIGAATYTASYRSSSSNSGATDSVVVTAPSGITNGDLILAFVYSDAYGNTITPPSGFTQVDYVDYGSEFEVTAYQKTASSESGDYTWGYASSTNAGVVMIVLSKTGGTWVTPTTSGYHSSSSANSDTSTTGAVTTQNGSVLVAAFGNDGNQTVSSAPADMTQRSFIIANTQGRMYAYTQDYATGASDVTKSLTWGASDQCGAIAVVVYAQ